MNSTTIAYQTALRPLSDLLDAVPAEAWINPSPCTGWTARDVVAHMIDTQRSLLTDHGNDPGPAPDLTDPADGFREHAGRVISLMSSDEVVDATYDGFFGPTTVGATLEQFYVWDMLVHRWDIARAIGGNATLSPEELDRIEAGADSFGGALHMEGICGPALPVPAVADRQTQLLARLGRDALSAGISDMA
ncbi:TIGR03086 family metal-binding protein [Arthrobacter sp. B1805]|uniref:TIGR03086 family metal-binding protein n=1 Tax=Arthrobacter sp. B1805 TaxID=2058892 RepID=UPI000CE4C90D|nr:TIGR03086 family metal-binding protein [Arthrobacter sp. B1805]